MSDRKTLRLHKWLDDPYRESLPTWVVESIRSVLESLDLQAGANAKLLAKNLRLEDENERLRADFADFREMHYDTKGEIERLRARIEAALALQESSDPPVYGLVVKALRGEK